MRDFENIKNSNIVKKNIISIEAKNSILFSKILPPDEFVKICECVLKTKQNLKILLTGVKYQNTGWEHVLVRIRGRCPTYREMILAKEIFWEDTEIAFQIYPAKSQNVNYEEYTLHLWRNARISKAKETKLLNKILNCYNVSKYKFTGSSKTIMVNDVYGKRLEVFGPMCWPSWGESVAKKHEAWNIEEYALQFHVSRQIDDNPEYLMILWDAKDFSLPPKEIV